MFLMQLTDIESKKERFKNLIFKKGLKWEEGLSPDGFTPKWIFDLREVILEPEGAKLAASLVYDMLSGTDFDAVGGPSLAAEPIVASLLVHSFSQNMDIAGFVVRKEPNNFGLRKKIEGPVMPGQKVILVDDALNTGRGIMDAVDHINRMGCKIVKIITIIDFMKSGHYRLLEQGYDLDSIFSLNDFDLELNETYKFGDINELKEAKGKKSQMLDAIKDSLEGAIVDFQMHESSLMVALDNGSVWCFDTATSVIKWSLELGESIFAPMLVDGNRLIVSAGSGMKRSLLFLIDVETGKSIGHIGVKGRVYSAPGVNDQFYLIGTDEKKLYCLDKRLEVAWTFQANEAVRIRPLLDDDSMYFCSDDGLVYALDFGGSLKWKIHCGKANIPPVIFENFILLKSEKEVIFCLNKHDGSVAWFFELKNKGLDMKLIGRYVAVGCVLGYLILLDIHSGEIRKTLKVSNENIKKIEANRDELLMELEDGKIYSLRVS